MRWSFYFILILVASLLFRRIFMTSHMTLSSASCGYWMTYARLPTSALLYCIVLCLSESKSVTMIKCVTWDLFSSVFGTIQKEMCINCSQHICRHRTENKCKKIMSIKYLVAKNLLNCYYDN